MGKTKTLLLGLAVIIVVFGVFIALPALVPSLSQLNCEKLTWVCTNMGVAPVNWDTWTWGTPEQPDEASWISALIGDVDEGRTEILTDIHRTAWNKGLGKLNLALDTENSSLVIVSGYLQYGIFPDAEDITENTTLQNRSTQDTLEPPDVLGAAAIGKILLEKYPLPELYGTLPYHDVTVTLTNYFLDYRKTKEELQVRTNKDGFFTATVGPDKDALYYTVVASIDAEVVIPKTSKPHYDVGAGSFPQQVEEKEPVQFYFPTETHYTTFIQEREEFRLKMPTVWWLILGLVLTVCLVLCYRYFRNRKLLLAYSDVTETEEIVQIDRSREIEKPLTTGGDTDRIEITFPDIAETLPDVWGVNEPLPVSFKLDDKGGDPLPSQDCEIDWGDGKTIHPESDEDGNINSVHVFTSKGEYVINASYREDVSGRTISGWKKIRIVDYREEMVGLFNEMLEKLELTDISIGSEMTPREIEEILRTRLEGLDETTIRRLISGFEEANYSTHPVTRDSYMNMYRSVSEVLGYGS